MSVSGLTIAVIVLNMVVAVAIPIGLCVFLRKKFKCDVLPFWVGCGVMFFFALVLEQIVHSIVLSHPVGGVIRGSVWLYALYGGLMAGLFEETGRFIAMKFLLKKKQGNDYNALMYGAGHGGFEAFYIMFFAMLNYLIYAMMINTGSTQLLLNSLDAANQAVLQETFDTLATASPVLFLASPVERLAAVTAQISMSVFVWFAAKENGKIGWYLLAVVLHLLLDATAALMSGFGVPIAVIEIAIWVLAVLYALLAGWVWKTKKSGKYK